MHDAVKTWSNLHSFLSYKNPLKIHFSISYYWLQGRIKLKAHLKQIIFFLDYYLFPGGLPHPKGMMQEKLPHVSNQLTMYHILIL